MPSASRLEAGADDAARHLVTLGAGEGQVTDRGRSWTASADDRLRLQGLGDLGAAQRVGDVEFLEPGNGDDIAGLGLLDRRALDAAKCENLRHPALFDDAPLWSSTLTA